MYREYRTLCKANPRRFNPGDSFSWKENQKPSVFNLGTQEDYWRSRATYEAIEEALQKMKAQADAEGIRSIAMPRIGSGYGGLSWETVKAVIESVFDKWAGTVFVYDESHPRRIEVKK